MIDNCSSYLYTFLGGAFEVLHLVTTVLSLGFKLSCGKSVKYRYIEFFAFDYDSLPVSFQSGIAVFL